MGVKGSIALPCHRTPDASCIVVQPQVDPFKNNIENIYVSLASNAEIAFNLEQS